VACGSCRFLSGFNEGSGHPVDCVCFKLNYVQVNVGAHHSLKHLTGCFRVARCALALAHTWSRNPGDVHQPDPDRAMKWSLATTL
jgi:hypothetical protein